MASEIRFNCFHCQHWRPSENAESARQKAFSEDKSFFTHPGPPGECTIAQNEVSKIVGIRKKPRVFFTKPGHFCNVLAEGRPSFVLHTSINLADYQAHLKRHVSKMDDHAGQ